MTLIFPVAIPRKVEPASEFGERLAALARALRVTTDEFLGVEPLQRASINGHGSGEDRRLWKKFQQLMALAEKDRRTASGGSR